MSPVPEDRGTTGRGSWLVTTARLTWAHLTSILGAFSLVTVLSHITGAQIQGWLTGLIDSWNTTSSSGFDRVAAATVGRSRR